MLLQETPMPPYDAFSRAVESYYLETTDGLFFAVKGTEHPPDRRIAVLRYVPDDEAGDRRRGGRLHRRLYGFAEQEQWIRTHSPRYLAYDEVFHATLQSVPRSMVRRVYDPRAGLKELSQARHRTGIQDDAAAFAELLQRTAGILRSDVGVTGSLLIGLQTKQSDLDIVVFGARECRKAYRALQRLLKNGSRDEIRRLDARGMQELYAQRALDTRMDFRKFAEAEERKVNQGVFQSRPYFIRFVKETLETGAGYGLRRYTPLGRAAIEATIADDEDAIFTPCRYGLSGVRALQGEPIRDLREIVSFRGRFCEQARRGERVTAEGTLERVKSDRGGAWQRLLLGNSPQDTIFVL
jgi:predicted nucleotidyltransferase